MATQSPAASPTADVLAYLTSTPMLFDLATKVARPLQPGAPARSWKGLRWSPDGKRILLVGADHDLVEVEVATGRTLRTLPLGATQTMGATYAGDQVVIGRINYRGDIWAAERVGDLR